VSSKLVRRRSRTLGRFDSFAAPLSHDRPLPGGLRTARERIFARFLPRAFIGHRRRLTRGDTARYSPPGRRAAEIPWEALPTGGRKAPRSVTKALRDVEQASSSAPAPALGADGDSFARTDMRKEVAKRGHRRALRVGVCEPIPDGNASPRCGVIPAMRRALVTLIALVGITLALASPAMAKLCVRIDAPTRGQVGSPVVVRVTTLLPTWSGSRLVDLRPTFASGRLRLTVQSSLGAYRELRLRRTADAAVWKATLRFQRSGLWLLTVAGWESAPRECAPPARIRVKG
jgi:hypothetical protein